MAAIDNFAVAEQLPTFHPLVAEAPPARKRTASPRVPTVPILGVPFDQVTIAEAVEIIERMIESREPHYIVTPNVDFLVQAMRDAELHRILFNADLVVCDGMPLVWASRWMGSPLPERVAGADLVPRLIEAAEQKGHRLYLLGATPEANEQAVANLRKFHPNLIVAGYYSPPFQPLAEMNHDEIADRIRIAKPDLLLVCFGCPKQEKWMAMNCHALGVPVTMGVGATIDFLAGRVRRAPRWMQRSGTEWLFRLAQEPRRLFRRYLMDLQVFGVAVAAQWWRLKFLGKAWWPLWLQRHKACVSDSETQADATELPATTVQGSNWQRIDLPRRFEAGVVRRNARIWDQVVSSERHCLLEASAVEFVDSAGMGVIISLHKRLQTAGWQLVLIEPSRAMRRAMTHLRLDDVLSVAADFNQARQRTQGRWPMVQPEDGL